MGAGSVATGVFSMIDWSQGPYYLKTEMDVNGGTNYTISGVTEFVSVPYAMNSKSAQKADTALYVKSVEKGKNIGEMNYWNGDAWVPISKGIQGQTLTYCDEKPTWTVGGICPGKIAALDCNSATNNGLIYSGRNTNVNSLLTYSGGNGGSYSTSSFTSEGVLGLVATISNSTLENGSGTLNITINGIAQSEGEALFNISFLGFNCQLKRNVMVYPATVSYLNCNTSYLVGQLTEGENATNVSGKISYRFGNDGVLSTFNVNSTGVSGLKAEIQGAKLYSDTGYYISYTITGVPGSSGTASFNLTIGGKSCVLNRVVKGKVVLVTFDANGGEVSVNSQTVTSGSVYGVLPTPTRTDYSFEGWELNTVKVTSQTVISTVFNHTLIAKWTGNTYLVTFDPNGGSVSTISKNTIFGSVYGELPVPTKTGYTFTGWDLNGVIINSQTLLITPSNHTLIAQWVANVYIVTFDANGGSINTISDNVTFGSVYGVLSSPTRVGFTFGGWELNGVVINEFTIVSTSNNHTLIARWLVIPSSGYGSDIIDIDGNTYKTVYIGTQQWMAENLKVSKYNNGNIISNIANTSIGAWVYYNNDETNNVKHGKLYNWYAVNTGKVCPIGWHVPTDDEWTILTDYLGGANIAGGKMKEVGTVNWSSPNIDASNASLFTALPSGVISATGVFRFIGTETSWWSSSMQPNSTSLAIRYHLNTNDGVANKYGTVKNCGFSIRCLKD